MVEGLKRLIIAGLAAVTLAGPLALTNPSASAAVWHGYTYGRYYHHGYYHHYYGYWPHHRYYYGYGPPPLLGALAAIALAPVALFAPYYYYGPHYYYGPGPYWW